jgi:hypothetical protein
MWIDPLVSESTDVGRHWVRNTTMDKYVRRENIKRYRKLLREVNDEAGRRLIQKLLLEEEQKEVPVQTPSPPLNGSSPDCLT